MIRNTKYNIIVFSDDHAEHRQFSLSHRTMITFFSGIAIGLSLLLAMGFFLWPNFSSEARLEELGKENLALKEANDRYLAASIEMEKKLRLFDEKTTRLAQFVGVEPEGLDVDGVGGPEFLGGELSRYLRVDLGLMEQKTQILEERFDMLGEAFANHTELLDSTPSILPARGWISSGFRYRRDPFTQKRTWHNGIDISCQKGTPIYAPAKGVIVYKGYQGGFGNLLELNHGNGLKTRFAHLDKFNVSKGQRVKRGDLIGYVGSTGRSTAPHLHFEIHKDDKAVNPMKYVLRDN